MAMSRYEATLVNDVSDIKNPVCGQIVFEQKADRFMSFDGTAWKSVGTMRPMSVWDAARKQAFKLRSDVNALERAIMDFCGKLNKEETAFVIAAVMGMEQNAKDIETLIDESRSTDNPVEEV